VDRSHDALCFAVRARFGCVMVLGLGSLLVACGETTVAIVGPDPPADPIDLTLDLLAYLPLDESAAGDLALDVSGYEHHGTPSANPPIPSTSVPPVTFSNPGSLDFNGMGQFLDLGNPPELDIEGEVTLCAWVQPRAVNGWRNVVAHGWHHQADQEVALRIDEGAYEFVAWDGVDHSAATTVPALDLGGWHHLCGTYAGGRYRLFRDGELADERPDAVSPMRVEETWAIGARGSATDFDPRYWDGLIDEVRIYGRALSAAEVRVLFRL
jgi:hypothetical protein